MGTRGTLITQADGAQAVTGRRRQGRRGARGASRPKRPEAPEARVAIYIVKSLFFEKNCAVKWLEWTIVENFDFRKYVLKSAVSSRLSIFSHKKSYDEGNGQWGP